MIEVKIGDDLIFIEKKYLALDSESLSTTEEYDYRNISSISGVGNVKEDDEEQEFIISLDDLEPSEEESEEESEESEEESEEEDDEEEENDDEEEENDDEEEEEEKEEENDDEEVINKKENSDELLKAKLYKSLEELKDIRSEMKNTFTSTDTISNTINSLKSTLDALKKDIQ